jgi:uncharacterized membrane protein
MATMTGSTDAPVGDRLGLLARQRPDQVAILAMAGLGVGVSLYLTAEHYAKAPLVCSTGGIVDCGSVLTSSYSVMPGTSIPITFPGMLWFVASGGLAIWGLWAYWRGQAEPLWLRSAQQVWGVLGLLTVLYLVSAEIDRIHHLCEWCTVVHLLVLSTLLISLYFRRIPKYDRRRLAEETRSSGKKQAARDSSVRKIPTLPTDKATSFQRIAGTVGRMHRDH